MKQNAITQAIGALKLVPIFVNNPAIVSRATMIGASTEAVALLEALPAASTELIEVFRCVNAVTSDGQTAYVTPTRCPEYPYGAVIADSEGHICAAAMGKTKEGLAELIRLKLLPPQEGYGEDLA
ncbi:MAG: hypothetical protein V4749_06400 [Pseudomonadota bacterium]